MPVQRSHIGVNASDDLQAKCDYLQAKCTYLQTKCIQLQTTCDQLRANHTATHQLYAAETIARVMAEQGRDRDKSLTAEIRQQLQQQQMITADQRVRNTDLLTKVSELRAIMADIADEYAQYKSAVAARSDAVE